jgi:hypothetical protein
MGRAAAGVWGRSAAGRAGAPSGILPRIIARFTWIAITAIVAAHLVLGLDDEPLPTRALLAVPGVLLVLEARRYLRSDERQLPFTVLALLQYYVAFGLPVFFEAPFYDLNGRVFFTESTRLVGGAAVALGALCMYGAARLALRFGGDLRGFALKMLPPDTPPPRWDQAFYLYTGVSVLVALTGTFASTVLPGQIAIAIFAVFPIELALGLATMRPPKNLGPKASYIFMGVGVGTGVLRGQLDPLARISASFIAAQWAVTRKVALGFIALVAVAFMVLQPAKRSYREQVWGHAAKTGQELGVGARVDAWGMSISDRFSSDGQAAVDRDSSALSRLSELEPVFHAISVVPQRIDYAYGQSLVQLLYAPIPRILWPDKPTSREEVAQRYAVIFGRQSERAAESTAVGMSVLVEGYWNLGWFGVAFVTGAVGLVVGVWQRVFSSDHWALGTIGISQIAFLQADMPMVLLYGSMFQNLMGRFLAMWLIFWAASILSGKTGQRRVAGRALAT